MRPGTSHRDRENVIAEFVATTLGLEGAHVTRIASFATNEVYEVAAGGQALVVKASTHDATRAEAWACATGAQAGCIAPEILGFGALDGRTSAFIMRRVAGSPVTAGHRALREVGVRLRRLHGVTPPGFGVLAEASWDTHGGFTLRHRVWLDFLYEICEQTREFSEHRASAATAAIDARAEALAAIDVGSLCHGDLKAAHVLVDETRIAGVIDWGDAVVADPAWDIARFAQRVDTHSLALLLEGYDPAGTMAADLAWRIPLYGALWVLVDAIVDRRLGADPPSAQRGA